MLVTVTSAVTATTAKADASPLLTTVLTVEPTTQVTGAIVAETVMAKATGAVQQVAAAATAAATVDVGLLLHADDSLLGRNSRRLPGPWDATQEDFQDLGLDSRRLPGPWDVT